MIRHRLFGAAHIDRIGIVDGPAQAGQSNPGTMREAPGGAALNVASSLARLGAAVSLSSIVSNDAAGARIREAVDARGIEWSNLHGDASLPTASYTALLDRNGDLLLALADMQIYDNARVMDGAAHPQDWMLVDANLPATAIAEIVKMPWAHRTAMTVSAAKAHRLRPVLADFNLLMTNRAEAAVLCDVSPDMPLSDLAAILFDKGCRRAVISDGANPLCYLEDGACGTLDIPKTEISDVTGAGDALTAGTLFALGGGATFADALSTGIRTAQAILTVPGPYRPDLATASGVRP